MRTICCTQRRISVPTACPDWISRQHAHRTTSNSSIGLAFVNISAPLSQIGQFAGQVHARAQGGSMRRAGSLRAECFGGLDESKRLVDILPALKPSACRPIGR